LFASFILNYETLPKESLIIEIALLHKTKTGNEISNHINDGERRKNKYNLHAIHATEEIFTFKKATTLDVIAMRSFVTDYTSELRKSTLINFRVKIYRVS
jgi:hypothetical protein